MNITSLLSMVFVPCLGGVAAAQLQVFAADFDTSIPAAIAPGSATLARVQGFGGLGPPSNQFAGMFLRSAGDNIVTLRLTGLPVHRSLSLDFLFAAIDSLDGAGAYPAGDFFKITLDGVVVFREAFANAVPSQTQTYVPPPFVTLARRVDLGFSGPGGPYTDSAYYLGADQLLAEIPHDESTATITFELESSQALADESWAIDQLRVYVSRLPTEGIVAPYGLSCGPTLQTTTIPGRGRPLPLTMSGLPSGTTAAFCALGVSNAEFRGAPLPLHLDFLGAPTCFVLQDFTVAIGHPMAVLGATATTILSVPDDIAIVGLPIFAQGWGVAGGARLTLSGGLRLVFGGFLR